jgi:hypothetical protein
MPLTIYDPEKAKREQTAINDGERRLAKIEQMIIDKRVEYKQLLHDLDEIRAEVDLLKIELKHARIPLTEGENGDDPASVQ